jgi:hypothetical protein
MTMSLREATVGVLTAPSPRGLWDLRSRLLEAGVPAGDPVWDIVGEFHRFLDELGTRSSSREYSQLASKLDISAVGGVIVEQLLEPEDPAETSMRLLSALLSEGLMVLATRQHVKAWEGELSAVYRSAAWYLYGELWHWAEGLKPDLSAADRRRLLDRLLSPALSAETDGTTKAVLLGSLFQVLLLHHLAPHLVRAA